MVRKARVWLDGDLGYSSEEFDDAGGVAVQTQTAALLRLCAAESLSIEEEDAPEPEPVSQSSKKPKRHLAGANWLDDWTLFLPQQDPPAPPKK